MPLPVYSPSLQSESLGAESLAKLGGRPNPNPNLGGGNANPLTSGTAPMGGSDFLSHLNSMSILAGDIESGLASPDLGDLNQLQASDPISNLKSQNQLYLNALGSAQ